MAIARFNATTGDGRIFMSTSYSRDDLPPVRLRRAARRRVLRRDAGLHVVLGELVSRGGLTEEHHPFSDELLVPPRSVLREERAQVAVVADAAGQPGRVQRHEGCERVGRRRRRRRVIDEQADQPHRLAAEIDPHDGFGARAVIALAEEEVERPMDGREARREVLGGELEQALRLGERLLAARQALLDRGR